MPEDKAGSTRLPVRIISITVAAATLAVCLLCSLPQAFASFSSESADQVIGVGRIQSVSTAAPSADAVPTARFETPEPLAVEPTQAVSQLAQPLDRGVEDLEAAIADINMIQRFGEPDEDGWFTTKASAYGPSSAGTHTALGTELTLTSMDIGIHIDHVDLMGRTVELMYGGVILRCRIVDTGEMTTDGRLFDLQPGVCTAFGAETPEFGWGVRTIKWRLVD
ncbi:MAG: hypothetical protein LBJ48_06170 [Coriobacteriales bacterium]|jgi:hypothetical protein|nr:hypothetical protein [Coriobacteriales bacterium]